MGSNSDTHGYNASLFMKALPKIKLRLWTAIMLGFVLLLLPAGAAWAQPADVVAEDDPQGQIESLQTRADAINKEIEDLNHNLELVVEQHNSVQEEFDKLTLELADSRSRLDSMLSAQSEQEQILNDRLKAVYKAGDVNFLSILLNSSSISDFYEQARYITKINEQDAKLQAQFEERAHQISDLTDEIDDERSRAMSLERDLSDQKEQIEAMITERQATLDQVDEQVKQLLAQEEERQRAEQARIAAEYQSMLNDLQINDQTQAQVVQTALQYLGVPYVWGGESPSGFDCSGLTKYVFAQFGVNLPHFAASQFNLGTPVTVPQLQPGDLLFWGPGYPHHVAIYIGGGKYIEAPDFGEVVKISTLEIDGDYAGARRYPLHARSN
jgi:cell wall-associated NlpC family hydrolase